MGFRSRFVRVLMKVHVMVSNDKEILHVNIDSFSERIKKPEMVTADKLRERRRRAFQQHSSGRTSQKMRVPTAPSQEGPAVRAQLAKPSPTSGSNHWRKFHTPLWIRLPGKARGRVDFTCRTHRATLFPGLFPSSFKSSPLTSSPPARPPRRRRPSRALTWRRRPLYGPYAARASAVPS